MPSSHPCLSVVSPVYYATPTLAELVRRLEVTLAGAALAYEIILVDDGSTTPDWSLISQLAALDPQIRGIRLSRNFGQHHAITAGLAAARGEWIVIMDCDLQDQPEEIIPLLTKALEGYEAVLARRSQRNDSVFTIWVARVFYKVLGYLTEQAQDSEVGNFRVYHHRLIDTVLQLPESTRYFPAMVPWAGFRQISLPVPHDVNGRPPTYIFFRRLQLGLDILLSNSDKPLHLTVFFSLLLACGAFGLGIVTLIRAFLGQIDVLGYASLIVPICFFSGTIITVLGIVGLYVGKTFEGVCNRPLYIIAETTP